MATPRWLDVAAPLLLAVLGAALCWSTWRKWPSPLVDFGRELYVPWQLTDGRALYGDVGYFFGPFSPYLNALLMRLLGVSWTAVLTGDLVVLAALMAVIYRLLRRLAGTWAACTACAVALCAYGFSQDGPAGNNNLITPFAHECTHGLLAAFVALWGLDRWIVSGRRRWLAIAGLGIGVTLLGKTEIGVAAVASCLAGFAAQQFVARRGARRVTEDSALLVASMALPLLAFLPLVGADGVLMAWRAAARARALDNRFLLGVMGLDHPGENLYATLACSAILAVVVLAALAIVRFAPRKLLRPGGGPVVLLLTIGLSLALVGPATMFRQVRALPIAVLAILAWSAYRAVTSRGNGAVAGRWITTAALAVFSLTMLARMLLKVVVYPYGFELALPATVLTVAFVAGILPELTAREPGEARASAAVLSGLGLAFAFGCVLLSSTIYARKTEPIGPPGDTVVATPRDAQTAQVALALVERNVKPNESLMVIPEGVIVNYWLRLRNPTPHYNFVPGEMAIAGGEERMIADMQAKPPDVILGIPSFTSRVYGFERFGVPGFGESIMDWIRRHYVPASAPGPEADAAAPLGIVLFRRRF